MVFSEIYQVTGPVERFASNIASEGYVVALPSSFHEFEGPEAIPYDTDGTDRGNKYKVCPLYTLACGHSVSSQWSTDAGIDRKDGRGI